MNFLSRTIANAILRHLTGAKRAKGGSPDEPRAVDPSRFGIAVKDPVCGERIRAILGAFFLGFERTLKGEPPATAEVSALLRPFHAEGAAMGCLPNGYFRCSGARSSLRRFEEVFCREDDPHLVLRYVGLGFWLGFRYRRRAERMDSVAAGLKDRNYRHLVHDGYGFKLGFFDLLRRGFKDSSDESRATSRLNTLASTCLDRLDGFARTSAFHGLGRSFWFYSMDRPEAGFRVASCFPQMNAIVSGMGLAAAFTFVDDLSRAYAVADRLEGEQSAHFQKGIRIALYVRAESDLDYLKSCLNSLEPSLQQRADSDLQLALRVGEATRAREDFIEAFHRGCLTM